MNTEFVNVNPENVIDESQKLKFDGYHLMQQCATRIPDAFELIYTFGKDLEVKQLKIKKLLSGEARFLNIIICPLC